MGWVAGSNDTKSDVSGNEESGGGGDSILKN